MIEVEFLLNSTRISWPSWCSLSLIREVTLILTLIMISDKAKYWFCAAPGDPERASSRDQVYWTALGADLCRRFHGDNDPRWPPPAPDHYGTTCIT